MELSVLPADTGKPSIIPESLGVPQREMGANFKRKRKSEEVVILEGILGLLELEKDRQFC